ncbi:hypothetical protein pdam_00023665 [Pocillopora damicornis]|uniref:Sugar phosphate transporter domain-containing protein n=1 Tax=Pocillopora damicornis TaxID=46731 RepID=A0A3M6USV7_POCDA|nr:hypothetical protein pdam_00023665 [Pocillopora damicornis]
MLWISSPGKLYEIFPDIFEQRILSKMMATTWRKQSLIIGLCVFSIITTLVNKHVLSDLRFTYPTVFQSWQTGTVAMVLLSLNALGYIEITFLPVTSATLASWLPASVLYSGIIYSGSVSLSRLPVPVFCAMCYLQTLLVALLESFIFKKEPSTNSQFSLIFTAIATVSVAGTDVQNSLNDLDKLFYNAVVSVIVLMGISVLTGELYKIIEFPFLYSTHFHLGCMGSGIFGAALGLIRVSLLDTEVSYSLGIIDSLNKVAISFLSLFIFDVTLDSNMAVSIIAVLCSGVLYSYTVTVQEEAEQRTAHPVRDS